MKKEQMVVVAAIIGRGGKYLITQRPKGKHLANKWEFPGGVVEFGEDPKEHLLIEIKEELGAETKEGVGNEVHVSNLLGYSSFVYENNRHVILLAFSGFLGSLVQVRKIGVQDYKWVSPKEMRKYDFCEADLPFVKKLQNGDLRPGGAIFQ